MVLCSLTMLFGGMSSAVASAAGSNERAFGPANQTLTEGEYWNLVHSSHLAITALKGLPPDKVKTGLAVLAAQWQGFNTVTLADGTVLQVDNSYLLSMFGAEQPNLDQLEHVLRTLETAHRTYPSHFFTTAELASLQRILARPEFRGLNRPPNPLTEWLQQLWTSLVKWFNDMLARILGDRRVLLPQVELSPLAILSTGILILVLVYAIRSVLADIRSEANARENGDGLDQPLTSESAFQKAQTLSREGDYRSAVRFLYLSCLLLLDERGLLRYDHFKTNREVLHSVSDSPELAGPLRDVIEVFDNVWYGYHTLDEESFRHYSQRVQELEEKRR